MQLRELHIDGFGIFSGHSLTGLRPGLNILVGRNEAGTSTLLQFVRYTLFGYPHSIEQRLPPVQGGNHGGRIKAVSADNREIIFERKAGYPGDRRLHLPDDPGDASDDWQRWLGYASAPFFNNVYGISLAELVGLESLSESGVEDRIFSVGLGLAGTSIGDMEKQLEESRRDIYKPRGTKQRIPQLKKKLDEKKAQIHEIQSHLPRYEELTERIEETQQALKQVKAEYDQKKNAHDRLDSFLTCYDSYVNIREMDRELSQLPAEQPCPENGTAALDQLEAEKKQLEKQISDLKRDKTAREKELADLSCNRPLADSAEAVAFLKANLEKYRTWQQEYHQDKTDVADLTASIGQRIAAISSHWNENSIQNFAGSIGCRDRLEEFQKRLTELRDRENQAASEYSALRSRRNPVSVPAACLMLALICWLAALPLLIKNSDLWAGLLLVTGLILFCGRRLLKTEDIIGQAGQRLEEIQAEKTQTLQQYRRFLEEELGLSPELSPAAALEAVDRIEQLKTDIQARDKQSSRLMERRSFLATFEDNVTRTAANLPEAVSAIKPAALAERIIQAYKEAVSAREDIRRRRSVLSETAEELSAAEAAVREIDRQIEELLAAAAAESPEDFRKKYRQNERRQELSDQRAQAVRTIEQIAGRNTADRVLAFLDANEKQALEAQRGKLARDLTDLSRRRDELNQKISACRTERERLRTASDLAAVMTEAETIREALKQAYKNWLTAGTALRILQQVKQQYEQEKQPAVIRNSSEYFRQMTEERYGRIHVSLEESEVMVFDHQENMKKIHQLSRGTREQLLISLRLGFIEEYEKTAEPLPLILDEILVNFDPPRARQTARLFAEFSRKRQTLLFTCHPYITDLFADRDVTVLEFSR